MHYEDFKLPDLIDTSLTPENAKERGYEYIGETIYQTEAPYDAMKDIIEMVEKEGVILGCSIHHPNAGFCGIHKPIE